MIRSSHVLACLLMIVLLTACGTPAAPSASSSAATATATTAVASAPSASSSGTRKIRHALGETEVPLNPQRIVAITGQMDLDSLLALGVKPIAAGDYNRSGPDQPFAPYQASMTDGIEALPVAPQTNFERLVLLKPDLIIGQRGRVEDIYDRLSAIAPTIALDWGTPWQDTFRTVAAAVGRDEQAEQKLAEIDQRIAAVAQQVKPETKTLEISIADVAPDYALVFNTHSHAAQLIDQLGLKRPAAQQSKPQDPSETYIEISLERLDMANGDIIFEMTHGDPEQEAYGQQLAGNALWKDLRAVKAGQVHFVGAHWYVPTVLTVPAVLDDLERYVIQE
jgi:iron complex transport system substrate-binding protein